MCFAGYVDCSERWADLIPSGPGRWHNLDAMQIGNGNCSAGQCMTEAQEQTIFSLYAVIKTPLIIGGDVRTLSGHSLDTYLNDEVIAINQDPLGAAGRQKQTDASPSGEVWSGPLAGGEAVAVLVNRGKSPKSTTLFWSDVGFSNSTEASLRDLWQHKDIGSFNGSYTTTLPPQSSQTLRLKPSSA